MRRRGQAGYLLVLVAICMSILSLSYLRLAASAALADDRAENEAARMTARYAAESGLVLAQQKLAGLKAPPGVGAWFGGELVNARFKVSVVAHPDKGTFTVLSVGTSPGEGGVLVTRTLEAQARLLPKRPWVMEQRREL